jgi:glycosyltransferase involved in cell wall biosynthesis
MRVVEVISGLGSGGAEKALARRLRYSPSDLDTHVVCTSSATSTNTREVKQFATLHSPRGSLVDYVRFLNPGFIICHNPKVTLRLVGHPGLYREVPIIVVAHNEISSEFAGKRLLLNQLLPRVNPRAALHIAVSSRAAAGIQCARARRVEMCLLGADTGDSVRSVSDPWPIGSKIRIVVLGRVSPQKNLREFVSAVLSSAQSLRLSGASILVVGDGEERTELERLVARWNIGDLIKFIGWVERPASLLRRADVLFIPSLYEGGPLTLYEALLCGTPVISTNVGAVEDVIRVGRDSGTAAKDVTMLRGFSKFDLGKGLLSIIQGGPVDVASRLDREKRFSWLNAESSAKAFYKACLTSQTV